MEPIFERDMPEVDAEQMERKNWRHDVHEETTYEQAERELKEIEEQHKYLFDAKYGII